MKKNGFVSTALIYTFFILFLALMVLLLGTYSKDRFMLEKYKTDIKESYYELASKDINLYLFVCEKDSNNNSNLINCEVKEDLTDGHYDIKTDQSYCKAFDEDSSNGIDYRYVDGTITVSAKERGVCNLYFTRANDAILQSGSDLNKTMKQLSGTNNADITTINTNIERILREADASKVPVNALVVSVEGSKNEINMWYQNNTIYYYSEADQVYLNEDSSYLLYNLKNLTNITGLEGINAVDVKNLSFAFSNNSSLTDLSPITNWFRKTNGKIYKLNNLTDTFSNMDNLTNLLPLSNWDISTVTDLTRTFADSYSLENLSGLSSWDTSKVTSVRSMFSMAGVSSSLNNVNAINNWNLTKVLYGDRTTNNGFLNMFYNVSVHPTFTRRAGTWENGTFYPDY